MSRKYSWVPGVRFNRGEAQSAGEALEALRKTRGGNLKAQDIIQEAQKKSSPLHNYFEWDDSEAAGKWRESQARYLLRSVIVVYEQGTEKERTIHAFVHVEDDGESVYTSTVRAMSSEELRRQILARALKEFEFWKERYEEYEELSKVFEAAEKAKRKLSLQVERLSA